jgi:dolichyl-diphosphooligosaccharide--protein glycosyltransferase
MKHSKLVVPIILAICIGVSAYLRISLPHSGIFSGDWIKFSSNDGYFWMHHVDLFSYHFPSIPYYDPYFIYPGGAYVGGMHFFGWLLAGIIWLVSFGHPTEHIIDVVGSYYPAVLGVLTIIPVYFIGKNLFGKVAGLVAAGLVAILPGEFLGRSLLGSTDQHVMETLLTTATMLFLILVLKEIKDYKRAIWCILTGLLLGLYLITWGGAPLFVVVITIFVVAQFIVNHMKRVDSLSLMLSSFLVYLIAFTIYTRASIPNEYYLALAVVLVTPVALFGLSRLLKNCHTIYYSLALFGIVAFGQAILYIFKPDLFMSFLGNFGEIFSPQGASAQTTLETQSFFSLGWAIPWGNFTTSLILAPVAFVVLVAIYLRNKLSDPTWLLLFVWTAIIVLANIVQRRFAYYSIINVALLVGSLSWLLIKLGAKSYTKRKRLIPDKINYVWVGFSIILILGVVFSPNISGAKQVATQTQFTPSDAWMESLTWMKNNTPEPFGSDKYYDVVKPVNPVGWKFQYPETAYGVTSWWDYGYWITRIAHRIPSANPSQSPEPIKKVANLFLSQDNATAERIVKELKSEYLIIDNMMVTSKFYALVTWVGGDPDDYMGIYYVPNGGRLQPTRLFYPEYYQSLTVRLFNFNGEAVKSGRSIVITWTDKLDGGNRFQQVTESREFTSYEDASTYANSGKNRRVVGISEFSNPMSLDKVTDYKLAYGSTQKVSGQSEVKIFQHIDK